MNRLQEFLDLYDSAETYILLEGKRNVLPEDQEKLVALGKLLASKSEHIIFRSGNASGADELFSKGVAEVEPSRLEVVTPYSGHRAKYNVAGEVHSLDDINVAEEPELIYHSKRHKSTSKLVDSYAAGKRDRFSMKAAYIIRDTVKVLGSSKIPKIKAGIFYDDLNEPMKGGTGHTMRVCVENDIPVITQEIWMNWL